MVLGGAALFALATGMGLPLIVVGVSEGALLPKAGPWMVTVRKLFGVLLLAVALWIVSPVISALAEMLAWAALAMGTGAYLLRHGRLGKAVGAAAMLAGLALLVGAAMNQTTVKTTTPWVRVSSAAELDDKLRAAGRPAMLDFYADWCVSCKEMEKFTLSDARVRAELANVLLLQADVTAASPADRELLKRFSLYGPPGIIFFDAEGHEIPGLRVIGYQPPERFLKTLAAATRH